MSVQVGWLCYADASAAAAAACAGHTPVTTVSGGNVVTLACSGAVAGKLQMVASIAPVDGSASAVSRTIETEPTFAPCVMGDIVDAGLVIVLAVLVAFVGPWGYLQVCKMLRWGRGEAV